MKILTKNELKNSIKYFLIYHQGLHTEKEADTYLNKEINNFYKLYLDGLKQNQNIEIK